MKYTIVMIAACCILLTSCSTKHVDIRSVYPPKRSVSVFSDMHLNVDAETPENCYTQMEDYWQGAIEYYDKSNYKNPLTIDYSAFDRIVQFGVFYLRQTENGRGGNLWRNNYYTPQVCNRAAWANLYLLPAFENFDDLDWEEWDQMLEAVYRAKKFCQTGMRLTSNTEWDLVIDKLLNIIDISYDELDWLQDYIRHWIYADYLPRKYERFDFLTTSYNILSRLENRPDKRFVKIIRSDIDDIMSRRYTIPGGDTLFTLKRPIDENTSELVTKSGSKSVGLCLGINKYNDSSFADLPETTCGANAMHKLFQTRFGINYQNIILRADPNKMYTRTDLKVLFTHTLPMMCENVEADTVYIYVAGHGCSVFNGTKYTILPSDANKLQITESETYTYQELFDDLQELPVKRIFIIFDTCLSETDYNGNRLRKNYTAGIKKVSRLPSWSNSKIEWTALYACSPNESSNIYMQQGDLAYTLFSYYLIKALNGEEYEKMYQDNRVTFDELIDYLDRNINLFLGRAYGSVQTPFVDTRNKNAVFFNRK